MRIDSNRPVVLVVEDEEVILSLVVRTLDLYGIEAIPAKNGVEGLEKFIANQSIIDAMFIDVNCEGNSASYDGPWLVKAMKKLVHELPPVKFVTGYNAKYSIEELERLSGKSVLLKALTPTQIISAIRSMLPNAVRFLLVPKVLVS